MARQIFEIKNRWKRNWEIKEDTEIKSRLLLWENFIIDLKDEKKEAVNENVSQVHHRIILSLILNTSIRMNTDESKRLGKADNEYICLTEESNFIWNRSLQPSFPKEEFGFMYRRPK